MYLPWHYYLDKSIAEYSIDSNKYCNICIIINKYWMLKNIYIYIYIYTGTNAHTHIHMCAYSHVHVYALVLRIDIDCEIESKSIYAKFYYVFSIWRNMKSIIKLREKDHLLLEIILQYENSVILQKRYP